jgi:hypothetical protein
MWNRWIDSSLGFGFRSSNPDLTNSGRLGQISNTLLSAKQCSEPTLTRMVGAMPHHHLGGRRQGKIHNLLPELFKLLSMEMFGHAVRIHLLRWAEHYAD